MNTLNATELTSKSCTTRAGGVEKYTLAEAQTQLEALTGWQLSHDGQRIEKRWKVRNFRRGMDLLANVAQLAEQQGHHPDLHLENYRHVRIEIWTHAIGGLSQNDFILAAKIDAKIDQMPAGHQ